jgi:hypothetical protein
VESSRGNLCLVARLPVFSTSLEHAVTSFVVRLSCLFCFCSIVGLAEGATFEIQATVGSFGNVLRVIIFRGRVLNMGLFVKSVVVVEVVESVYLISLSLSARPDLVCLL